MFKKLRKPKAKTYFTNMEGSSNKASCDAYVERKVNNSTL